jgi:hypothetical protein
MKQTAVDFIVTKFNYLTWLRRRGEISEVTEYEMQAKFFFEAKKMEKEQHKQTWLDSTVQFDNAAEMTYKKDFEQYYNETFNTNEK